MTVAAGDVILVARVRAACADGSLRARRQSAGMSLNEVAQAIGANLSAVSLWERGLRRPGWESAIALGRLLDELPVPQPLKLRPDGTLGTSRPLRVKMPFVQSAYGTVVHRSHGGHVCFYDSGADPMLVVHFACGGSTHHPSLMSLLPDGAAYCGKCETKERKRLAQWVRRHGRLLLDIPDTP